MAQYISGEALLDATTAQAIESRVGLDPARALRLTCGNSNVRYRFDGGAPTVTVGHRLLAGAQLELRGADALRNLRLISELGASNCRYTVEGP